MYQVIEEIEELLLAKLEHEEVYGLVGKKTKKLLGVKILSKDCTTLGPDECGCRTIYFHDIDRIKQNLKRM